MSRERSVIYFGYFYKYHLLAYFPAFPPTCDNGGMSNPPTSRYDKALFVATALIALANLSLALYGVATRQIAPVLIHGGLFLFFLAAVLYEAYKERNDGQS